MKRIYVLPLLMLLSVSVLKAQTPLEMNDKLAVITDSLYAKGQNWGYNFNDAYKSGDYSILKPLTSGLLAYINSSVKYVENMKDVKNSKPLRMAILDLLAFEKRMMAEGFRPFESFDGSTPKEKVQAALATLTEKSKEEDGWLKKLSDAQDVYAGENGFTIEK